MDCEWVPGQLILFVYGSTGLCVRGNGEDKCLGSVLCGEWKLVLNVKM